MKMKQEQLRQHDWSRPIAVARAAGVGILAGGVVGCFRFVIQLGLSQVQYFFWPGTPKTMVVACLDGSRGGHYAHCRPLDEAGS